MVIFLSVNFQRFLVDCQDARILLSLIKKVEKIRFLCLTHCIVLHKTIINWLFFNKRKLVLQRQIWTQPSALFVCIVIVKRAIIFNFVYIILSVGRAQPKETRLNNNLILIKASPLLIQNHLPNLSASLFRQATRRFMQSATIKEICSYCFLSMQPLSNDKKDIYPSSFNFKNA